MCVCFSRISARASITCETDMRILFIKFSKQKGEDKCIGGVAERENVFEVWSQQTGENVSFNLEHKNSYDIKMMMQSSNEIINTI